MTTLVTGATGFVGSAVVRRLLARGEAVRVLARPGGDRRNLAGLDVEVAEGDLDRPETLAPAVRGVRALYHVAADYRIWVPDPTAMHRTNVEGTRCLLRLAAEAGVGRMVFTSSVAALGIDPSGRPGTETTPVRPGDIVGPYKRSKHRAQQLVEQMAREDGLPVVIVNPSTPVGPRDLKPTPTGRMIVEAARGRMPAFVDTGLNLAHVDDVAEGHLLAFDRGQPGERYILGGTNLTLRQILHGIAAIRGHRPPRIRLPNGALVPLAIAAEAWARRTGREPFVTRDGLRMAKKRMFFGSGKAERELGYAARPVDEALRDAIAWFDREGYLGRPR